MLTITHNIDEVKEVATFWIARPEAETITINVPLAEAKEYVEALKDEVARRQLCAGPTNS